MKTLIKLAILVIVMNAAYQAIHSYYVYMRFKDEIHSVVLNGIFNGSTDMHQAILDLGQAYGLELAWDTVQISRVDEMTVVDLDYVDTVHFVPRVYSRPWSYNAKVVVRRTKPLKLDELAR